MPTPPPSDHAVSLPRPVALLAITLAMVTALVVWTETAAYRALAQQQQEVARHSVNMVGAELAGYLTGLQRAHALLGNGRTIGTLAATADGDALPAHLRALLGSVHDAHQAVTLANARGELLYQSKPGHTSDRCRQTIRDFAADPRAPAMLIHGGRSPDHMDLLQRVALVDGSPGVLVVSYRLDRVTRLLRDGAAPGHQLFLVRLDRPGDIAVAAEGAPDRMQRDARLSGRELRLAADYGASRPVAGSNWRLIDLPDGARLADAQRLGWLRGAGIFAAALLFGLITLRRIREESGRRAGAEQALREAHGDLERKVAERTSELSRTNQALAAQVARRREAEERMTKLSQAVENTGDSIIIADRDGLIEYANPAFERMTGRTADSVIGTPLADLQSAHEPQEFLRRLWQHLEKEHVFREIFCTRNGADEPCYTEQTITPLQDDSGQVSRLIATGKDITERMDSERRLSYLAHHDTLTGLPNRALMFDRLSHALARANRKDTLVALLFMDIDRFKTINDSLGHQAGDELLVAVAQRLDGSVRRSDSIARLGGDEFVAILEDIRHPEEPVHVASAILAAIAQPLTLAGQEVSVTSSMGITLYPDDAGDANALLQCADTAMYQAKAEGGNTYNFYTADMTAEAQRRLRLESRLRNALDKDEFQLLYQPRLDLASRRITAVEALLRWQPPGEDVQGPADFMPVLEETGLIRQVGEWVLRRACADFGRLQGAGHQLRIACNLSAKQFRDSALVAIIDRTLADQAMRPGDLELEITESVLSGDMEQTAQVLAALHARGVRISVDDFGTGYSSLTCLKRFPIDDLKVDQSFIHDLNDDKEDATIVAAIISLAHSLGLGAVAEGVETRAQLQTLGLLGCDEVQGMLVSEPLRIDGLLDWLGAHGERPVDP